MQETMLSTRGAAASRVGRTIERLETQEHDEQTRVECLAILIEAALNGPAGDREAAAIYLERHCGCVVVNGAARPALH